MATNGIDLLNKGIAYGKKIAKWLLMAGIALLVIAIVLQGKKNKTEKKPTATATQSTATDSGKTYAASYDFSKITGNAATKTFAVPKGDGWVLVALPAYYRATFSSASAKSGELDKLDGSKPLQFGEHTDFGKLPMSVAVRVPEGCEMTVSFVKKGQQVAATKKEVSSKKKQRAKKEEARKDRPDGDIPKSVQIM